MYLQRQWRKILLSSAWGVGKWNVLQQSKLELVNSIVKGVEIYME